jgi:arylsulfatase
LLKGKPVFLWNLLDLKRVRWESPEVLTPGKHTLEYDFKYEGLGFATLAFNNVSGIVATEKLERTVPITLPWDETFDVGSDTGTPVDDQDYQVPFNFTGKIDKLTISVERPKLTPEDQQRLMQGQASAADAQ